MFMTSALMQLAKVRIQPLWYNALVRLLNANLVSKGWCRYYWDIFDVNYCCSGPESSSLKVPWFAPNLLFDSMCWHNLV